MRALSVAVLMAGGVTACSDGGTEPELALPAILALRSDTPYIAGTIVHRWTSQGDLKILVEVPDHHEARVRAAVVTIDPDAVIVWPDGSRPGARALQVGRFVTVWVTGAELRSLPPQVRGTGFLLHR